MTSHNLLICVTFFEPDTADRYRPTYQYYNDLLYYVEYYPVLDTKIRHVHSDFI